MLQLLVPLVLQHLLNLFTILYAETILNFSLQSVVDSFKFKVRFFKQANTVLKKLAGAYRTH